MKNKKIIVTAYNNDVDAIFLKFGVKDGSTVAIIKYNNGKIDLISVEHIKFIK